MTAPLLTGLGLRRRLFARFYDRVQARYEVAVAGRRRALLASATGAVLELGPGTGINFKYLPKDIRWLGVEPNRHMHPRLRARAEELGFAEVEFRTVAAEGMQVPDGSIDTVVSTIVLCSVADPHRVLADVVRVLRPGGRFLFLEHVAAPPGSRVRRRQRCWRPFLRFFADGCTPDRETGTWIGDAGFATVELEEFELEPGVAPRWVAPHVIGVATR